MRVGVLCQTVCVAIVIFTVGCSDPLEESADSEEVANETDAPADAGEASEGSAEGEGETEDDAGVVQLLEPREFKGRPVAELLKVYGNPPGRAKNTSGKAVLLYPDFTVTSEDGKRITNVEYAEDYEEIISAEPRAAPPPSVNVPPVLVVANGGQQVAIQTLVVHGKITIVDFYADWCGPCRAVDPALKAMATGDDGVVLRKVDIVNWGTPVCQQHKIRSVPNMSVYDPQGKLVGGPTADLNEVRRWVAKAR